MFATVGHCTSGTTCELSHAALNGNRSVVGFVSTAGPNFPPTGIQAVHTLYHPLSGWG